MNIKKLKLFFEIKINMNIWKLKTNKVIYLPLLQTVHLKSVSPLCIRKWLNKPTFVASFLLHPSQGQGVGGLNADK